MAITLELLQVTWWRLSMEAPPPPTASGAFLYSWRTRPLATDQAPCSAPPADPLKKGRGQKITHENQKQNPIGTTNGNGLGKKGPGILALLIKPCVPQPSSPREQARPGQLRDRRVHSGNDPNLPD